ncbi:659_t:CDS:1 [Scutellospora calospora]|uniref:659_t:CDS:1 n=1 Tax=Scutellospora calospora TaxID=85575 RepID=A0ACA9LYA2_9GLOM|nr:659_t:CDS:1 [Scutellospora calospora]
MFSRRLFSTLRLGSTFTNRSFLSTNVPSLIQFSPIVVPISKQVFNSRSIYSNSTLNNAAPTVYEVDKDYWSLKTTIDDIRAKYGLGGGTRIKDPNLDQNSDLDLEIDLTVADIKKIVKIQQLLEKAAQDLSYLVSASPPEIFSDHDSFKDDDVAIKANAKKVLWLVEDDDVSGNAKEAIRSYKENRVAGDVTMNAYTLEDGKDENPPVGFRQDLYQ